MTALRTYCIECASMYDGQCSVCADAKKEAPELDTETVARAMYELWRRGQLYMSWEDLSDAANDYKSVARTRELWLSLAEATRTKSSMLGLIEAMKLP